MLFDQLLWVFHRGVDQTRGENRWLLYPTKVNDTMIMSGMTLCFRFKITVIFNNLYHLYNKIDMVLYRFRVCLELVT